MLKRKSAKLSIFILSTLLFTFLLLSLFFLSSAVSADTPIRPSLTPTPHPTTTAIPPTSPQTVQSATIILTMATPDPAYWTSVQWIDEHDEWQDVSGWQSDFNEAGLVAWAVATKDYGTGPYRWVIYDEENGEVQSITDSFYLPERKRIVWINGDE